MRFHTANLPSILVLVAAIFLSSATAAAQNQQGASAPRQSHSSQSAARATVTAQTSSNTIPLPVLGSGTTNFVPLWTGRQVIGTSILSQVPGGLNVAGSVTGTSFFGDGSHLVNVNALTLQGLSPSSFVQTGNSNTFTGNQTINGNLTLTGFLNNALTLQGGLIDGNGQEGANILGGFAGDPATGASGNLISPGVIGATIAGGGGSYDSSILPQRPQIKLSTNSSSKFRLQRRAQRNNPTSTTDLADAQSAATPLATGIQPGPNVVQLAANWSTVGGGLKNTAAGFASTVAGGFDNVGSGNYSVVAGGNGNVASGSEAAVAGGSSNSASGDNSSVAGGYQNTASADHSTVGGGSGNRALTTGDTVAGGEGNLAQGPVDENDACGGICPDDTVGGGFINSATGGYATVSGGYDNSATGYGAIIPGGGLNKAKGFDSFAAGAAATANFDNSFVWSDGSFNRFDIYAQDTAPSQFVASAAGGFFFYDASDLSTGVTLPTGSGSWNSMSDRNVKENFSDVDGKALLNKLAAMPVLTWNYKAQAKSIRHMGPMAQDFREAFNLGEDEKYISTVDAQGVALAAIQALYRLTQEKDEKIAELTQALRDKDQKLDEMEHRLSRLEQVAAFANSGSTTAAQSGGSGPLSRSSSGQ